MGGTCGMQDEVGVAIEMAPHTNENAELGAVPDSAWGQVGLLGPSR